MAKEDPDFVSYINKIKTLPENQKAILREHLLRQAGIVPIPEKA